MNANISDNTRPIHKIPNFLSASERDALFAAACGCNDQFHAPGGSKSDVITTRYWAAEAQSTKGNPLYVATRVLATRITESLPDLFHALNLSPFPVTEVPIRLIHGVDGHGGAPHADATDGRFDISLLYYFPLRCPASLQFR